LKFEIIETNEKALNINYNIDYATAKAIKARGLPQSYILDLWHLRALETCTIVMLFSAF